MNTAAASVMRDSAAEPPILNRIRNTRAFLRKLSLNAEKNWHQNSGAKRRDSRRDLEAAGDGAVMGQAYAKNPRLRPAWPHREGRTVPPPSLPARGGWTRAIASGRVGSVAASPHPRASRHSSATARNNIARIAKTI